MHSLFVMTEQLEIPLLLAGEANASAQSSQTGQPASRVGILNAGLLSYLSIDCKFDQPAVYGIGDKRSGKLIYIGKSENPKIRFEAYRAPNSCHNENLKRWLKRNINHAFCTILYSGLDIDKMEVVFIKQFKNQLFNLEYTDDQSHKTHFHNSAPWAISRRGILTPSASLMRWLTDRNCKRKLPRIRAIIRNMTTIERINFEISLAMDFEFHPDFRKSINTWADFATPKMLPILESSLPQIH